LFVDLQIVIVVDGSSRVFFRYTGICCYVCLKLRLGEKIYRFRSERNLALVKDYDQGSWGIKNILN